MKHVTIVTETYFIGRFDLEIGRAKAHKIEYQIGMHAWKHCPVTALQ